MTEKIKKILPQLVRIANQLYGYYGGPVYLIGSALYNENPRDIDIRVVISVTDFNRIYGNYEKFNEEYISGEFDTIAWKWVDDRLKRCRDLYQQTSENIDFSVIAEPAWNPVEFLRLDTRTIFDAKKL